MRRTLKLFHEIGTVGVMGVVSVQLVLAWTGTTMEPAEHAVLRKAILTMDYVLLLPSLALVLLSGLFAWGFNKSYHSADWVLIKAVMTPLILEATFIAVYGPAQHAATLTSRLASGDADAASAFVHNFRHEQVGLWVVFFMFTANIWLAIWRPRRRSRKAEAVAAAATTQAPVSTAPELAGAEPARSSPAA